MTKKDIQMRQDIGTPAGRAGGSKKQKKTEIHRKNPVHDALTNIEA